MSDGFLPYTRPPVSDAELLARAERAHAGLEARRSVRQFSRRPVPRAVIEQLLLAASSAPSGAHKQPWTFVAVSDPAIKAEIRRAAEVEEQANYGGRMNEQWLADLAPLGTDWHKPFLEDAPWLVVVFAQAWGEEPDGRRHQHYYVKESVGIACGLFLAAVHEVGLVTLTHTPSPMAFLSRILGRPEGERPYLLFPVGHPAEHCRVPRLVRKGLDAFAVFHEGG